MRAFFTVDLEQPSGVLELTAAWMRGQLDELEPELRAAVERDLATIEQELERRRAGSPH